MNTLYNTEPNDIPTLLIVEDDISVAEGLSDILTGYQYQVFHTERTADTMDFLEHQKTDLIILDVHLDGENGYELCKKIRELWDIPILYLTGCSSEMELVRGFQSGGDDYMTKPFRMQELIVRIQALLRRSSMQKNHLRKSGNLIYDRERKILKNNQGTCTLDLTVTELKLAEILIENYPRTLTREELMFGVWDRDGMFVSANTLNVNISRLREKLGIFDGKPYIETLRGIGYRWAIPVRR